MAEPAPQGAPTAIDGDLHEPPDRDLDPCAAAGAALACPARADTAGAVRRDQRLLWAVAAVAGAATALIAICAGAGAALVWSTLSADERATLGALLGPRVALLWMVGVAAVGAVAALTPPLVRRWIEAPARLLEDARAVVGSDVQREVTAPDGTAAVRGLAQTINDLVGQREQLRRDIALEVAQASRGVEQERNRLAALMNELTQSVVVCNLDGRILLYNSLARAQFRALSDSPAVAGGAELIGLGRSIYTVFERPQVAHALERVQLGLLRGAARPTAQFVTVSRSGQLLRALMAPVRVAQASQQQPVASGSPGALDGFVLMLDNVTARYEQQSARVGLMQGLTDGSRSSLARLQATVERLADSGLDAAARVQLVGVVRDETLAMSRRINELAQQTAQDQATRWPLEPMRGAEFVQAAQRRIESGNGQRVGSDEVDQALWLQLDSFSLLQALAYLALRLRDEFEIGTVHLRLGAGDAQRAWLDLVWTGHAMSTETVMSWELDPIGSGAAAGALTVRDVVQRHGGEFAFDRDRVRHQACFRFVLPLAPASVAQRQADNDAAGRSDSRPEYYDFDLFAASESSHALDERRLAELSYTVFDTETTGLDPAAGDEIIQIGATRLVNGRLLRGECFDQLVDPQRSIPAATIPIHGITPDMVAGQPTIADVLPAFHRFAADTVLVAHNAAFDMRFLQLKEGLTGRRFDQPVLDTLLLSAVVHPNQESHRLEAIAERLAIPVHGRHTALGDAMATAEIFQKLLPLLADMGIHTLGQAREAAQKTYYARLRY